MRKTSVFLIIVLLLSMSPVVVIAQDDFTPQAEALKELGLFLGTNSGFELDRAATRTEAAVMTVRLLGKEAEARKENFPHPFTDVPSWASFYVGYLYHYKITLGVSETQFGSSRTATSAQYATFVLRSLGYDDSAGDFSWDRSLDKMIALGIITRSQATTFSSKPLRGYIASISHLSLFANIKGTDTTLLEKLYLQDNAISLAQMKAASVIDSRVSMASSVFGVPKPFPEGPALDSEQIFNKASDAIFKMEIKAISGLDFSTGSGFFITSDGIAVTNMHVVSHMSSATVITPDGKEYPVEGVIAIEPKADLAIIKVKGSGFPYLDVGDPAALRTAQRIYCIGSPLGFDNTISEGLVSNPDRDHEGQRMIQISASIAPGSSGGALLNEHGQVVGVTTLGYEDTTINFAAKITDLVGAFRFPQIRSIKYMQAHSHFNAIPVTDLTYTRIESEDESFRQTMRNDTVMYGTISNSNEVHYYSLDVKEKAEMIISLTSDAISSASLSFEVADPSGKVVLQSRHYEGEIFSIATGHGSAVGLYTLKIFVTVNGGGWTEADYEVFWLYHKTAEVSEGHMLFLEFEPNDTQHFANYIPDSGMYFATIFDRGDIDHFTFTLTSTSRFIAVVSTDSEKSVLNVEVFDSIGRSVGKSRFVDGVELFEASLSAGNYYIKISVKDTSMVWDNQFYVVIAGAA